MTNKIVIDAWNVIWKMPSLSVLIPSQLEQARSKFNIIIKNYYVNKNVTYKIVYDGQRLIYSSGHKQDPNVSYSRNPEKADDVIIMFLKKQSSPKEWTVITSDRYLSHRVRNVGAQIESSEFFITKIDKSIINQKKTENRSDPRVNEEDISYWLDKFGSGNSNGTT